LGPYQFACGPESFGFFCIKKGENENKFVVASVALISIFGILRTSLLKFWKLTSCFVFNNRIFVFGILGIWNCVLIEFQNLKFGLCNCGSDL